MPGKVSRASVALNAQAAHEAAKWKLQNSNAVLKAAQAELSDAQKALSQAKKTLHGHLPELQKLQQDYDAAVRRRAAFQGGPMAAFQFLRSRTTEVPVPTYPDPPAESCIQTAEGHSPKEETRKQQYLEAETSLTREAGGGIGCHVSLQSTYRTEVDEERAACYNARRDVQEGNEKDHGYCGQADLSQSMQAGPKEYKELEIGAHSQQESGADLEQAIDTRTTREAQTLSTLEAGGVIEDGVRLLSALGTEVDEERAASYHAQRSCLGREVTGSQGGDEREQGDCVQGDLSNRMQVVAEEHKELGVQAHLRQESGVDVGQAIDAGITYNSSSNRETDIILTTVEQDDMQAESCPAVAAETDGHGIEEETFEL